LIWKALDCFIPLLFYFILKFVVSSCIQNKIKDSFLPCEASALFQQVRNGDFGLHAGGTDASGRPIGNISDAVGLSYSLCLEACGAAQEPFEWAVFSQKFNTWMLPWLALISQLPFGTGDRIENLTSALLAVGSPTLAAYSLALTALNCRWVARCFSEADITHPNSKHAFHIMRNLQQAPLNITEDGLLQSLVVLPKNDG
jgi:hypothetical protein